MASLQSKTDADHPSFKVFCVQELVRTLSATLANVNPEGVDNGQNAMRVFTFLLDFPGMREYAGKDLYTVYDCAMKVIGKNGSLCRNDIVREMLTYPHFNRDVWKSLSVDDTYRSAINDRILPNHYFYLTVHNGEIAAETSKCQNLTGELYETLSVALSGQVSLIGDFETFNDLGECNYIPVISSKVIAEVGVGQVGKFINEFVEKNPLHFHVEFDEVKTAYFEDRSKFRNVVIMGVKSDYLKTFLAEFNERFDKRVEPNHNLTIAVVRRDLFSKFHLPGTYQPNRTLEMCTKTLTDINTELADLVKRMDTALKK